MNKRQECALKTRQKLLDTATDLIIKGDFHSLNIEDITKACGCAKGSFYTYFKNKQHISCEVCRKLFGQIAVRMQQMKNKTFLERLKYYFESFMVEVERYDVNICREWVRNVIDPKVSNEEWDNTKWQFDVNMLQNVFKQAVKDKELKTNTPIELITHIMISELYGMMTCWCMSDGVFEPKDWTNCFFTIQIEPMLKPYLLGE